MAQLHEMKTELVSQRFQRSAHLMSSSIQSTRGSTLVEGTAVLTCLILLIGGLFAVLYLSFSQVWVKSALYDGLVCVQENRGAQVCREKVQARFGYLPWSKTKELNLGKNGEGHALLILHKTIELKVRQSLPEELR